MYVYILENSVLYIDKILSTLVKSVEHATLTRQFFYFDFMKPCHSRAIVDILDMGCCSKKYQLLKIDEREMCQKCAWNHLNVGIDLIRNAESV